uniref:Uncharacterized protein n=1 Tax=Terrapene triunguis TaxID=2587831 RepID=A0A674INW3_9SAUR
MFGRLKVPHKEKDCIDIIRTTRCLLHACLVLLFSTEISSRLCTMLHFQQNKMNKESLELLKKRNRNFPSQCINERAAFKPTQDILQDIFNIFSKTSPKVGLYQQIQGLEACLRAQMKKDLTNPESKDLQLTSQRVKQYFHGIDAFLKEKQYSLCAWEIIRMEIPSCFVLVDKLTRRLSN